MKAVTRFKIGTDKKEGISPLRKHYLKKKKLMTWYGRIEEWESTSGTKIVRVKH